MKSKKRSYAGIELRDPYESELSYFQSNPHVAGMAAEDDRIILNPYSSINDNEKKAVIMNEAARVFMKKNNLTPRFKITDSQKNFFKGYGDETDIRRTIAARALSMDPSVQDVTQEQMVYAAKLRKALRLANK